MTNTGRNLLILTDRSICLTRIIRTPTGYRVVETDGTRVIKTSGYPPINLTVSNNVVRSTIPTVVLVGYG